jgi:hypothetical protein
MDPEQILAVFGSWPSIISWMQFLNLDDDVAVQNAMAVPKTHTPLINQ